MRDLYIPYQKQAFLSETVRWPGHRSARVCYSEPMRLTEKQKRKSWQKSKGHEGIGKPSSGIKLRSILKVTANFTLNGNSKHMQLHESSTSACKHTEAMVRRSNVQGVGLWSKCHACNAFLGWNVHERFQQGCFCSLSALLTLESCDVVNLDFGPPTSLQPQIRLRQHTSCEPQRWSIVIGSCTCFGGVVTAPVILPRYPNGFFRYKLSSAAVTFQI